MRMLKIREYINIIVEHEIVRRYVITNTFDGLLAILGMIFAEFFSGITDPKLVLLPGIGAAIAMCISGIWGAYSAERAEIKKKIRSFEAHLLKDLSDTEFSRKRERMAIVIGLVDGLSPFIAAAIVLMPFFFVSSGVIEIKTAYYTSISLSAVVLFTLGALAGKIAKENIVKQGMKMMFAGAIIGLIFFLMTSVGILR